MRGGPQQAPVSAALDAVWNIGARALAAGVFLFLLNAFIQSGDITAAEAGVGLGWLAVCYWLSGRLPILHVLVATFLACVAWGLFLESRPLSDWLVFHGNARDFAAGSLHEALYSNRSKSPTTTVYQGLFHWLLGSSWVTNYFAGALLWTGGAACVYKALRPFTGDTRLARFVCVALALCPTFLVFSPVVGSKGVFFLVSAMCAWLLSCHVRRAVQTPWRYAAGMGLATGLLFLTRPHGVLLLAVCLPVVALLPAPSRRSAQAAALMLGVFAAVVLGYGGLSHANGYGFKVVTHPGASQVLLHGTNVSSHGMHSTEDLELLPSGTARLPEGKKRMREIAFERILADVPGFVRFAFTTKMETLYGRDRSLFRRARGDDGPADAARTDWIKTQVQPVVERIEQGVYRLVFLLFLVLLLRELWRPGPLLGLGGVVLLYSLPHLLLEVDQRYHMMMMPYFVVGAVFLFHKATAATQRGRRRRRPATTESGR